MLWRTAQQTTFTLVSTLCAFGVKLNLYMMENKPSFQITIKSYPRLRRVIAQAPWRLIKALCLFIFGLVFFIVVHTPSTKTTVKLVALHSDQPDSNNCHFGGLSSKLVFSGNLTKVPQDDPELLNFIRTCVIVPPSTQAYNLKDPNGDPSAIQGVRKYVLEELLGNKRNGRYIDCGANDGEDISNTLVLERDFGWSGLLIEADSTNYKNLLAKNRKAWVAGVCAGIKPYPYEVEMYRHKDWPLTSRLAAGGYGTSGAAWTKFSVKCLPLYTMMVALNLTDLDYMSMDIEGVELQVLETLPWNKIHVKVFSIETLSHTWANVREFMKTKGYAFVKTIRGPLVEDDVFAHKSLLTESQLKKYGFQ